jgi:hypothetical protein
VADQDAADLAARRTHASGMIDTCPPLSTADELVRFGQLREAVFLQVSNPTHTGCDFFPNVDPGPKVPGSHDARPERRAAKTR